MQRLPEGSPAQPTTGTPPSQGVVYPALPQVPWSTRDVMLATVMGFGLLAGLTIVLSAGLGAYLSARGRTLAPASGLVTLLVELALLIPVWWFGLRKYRLSWRDFGLRPFSAARGLGLGCAFVLVAFWFNMAWTLFLSLLGLRAQPDILPLFGGGVGGLLLALFTGGLIAPLAEELFFRGFVFAGLQQRLGLRRALVLNGVLFAVMHILPTSWPPIFVLGVLFALMYEQTGSIWPAVAVHGAINSISFVALFVMEALSR
jgi:membrane protease YdiL (CAAX protease family)